MHMHTIPEAAEMLGVSPQTLRFQARLGRLRAVKIGREWVVRPEEIERYRRENRRPIARIIA
jgi:excisionase family DNA binding protein